MGEPLLGALDVGTSSVRFMLFGAVSGRVYAQAGSEIEVIMPRPGWVEHNPDKVEATIFEVMDQVCADAALVARVAGVGITNHRESVIVWDRASGRPLTSVVVWSDTRTASVVDEMAVRAVEAGLADDAGFSSDNDEDIYADPAEVGRDALRSICGLPFSTYFSAVKIRWLMQNVDGVAEALGDGSAVVGTVDAWVIYLLTGRVVTDVTNASRTMLMDLEDLDWSPEACDFFEIPMDALPAIVSSSGDYGKIVRGALAETGVSVTGCLGDQQAALVGQRCVDAGFAKSTYGTGCFMLLNTGPTVVQSKAGLLTTVAFRFSHTDGRPDEVAYALEGSVAIAGAGVQWCRDQLGIIASAPEINTLAQQVASTGDVYVVFAFSGLYAPYWRSDARGCIVGLTRYTNRCHIARAVLESSAFRTRDVLEAMLKDAPETSLQAIRIDGGMAASECLPQMLADLLGVDVHRPAMLETTALGAAIAAGIGCGVYDDVRSAAMANEVTVFEPTTTAAARNKRYARWGQAVERSFGWATGLYQNVDVPEAEPVEGAAAGTTPSSPGQASAGSSGGGSGGSGGASKLTAVLGVTTALFAGLSAYLWTQRRS